MYQTINVLKYSSILVLRVKRMTLRVKHLTSREKQSWPTIDVYEFKV